MSDNLLKIGSSAILSNSALLATTSNNIANVNSQGYNRQRTEYQANILGLGVGRGTTERLVNDFAVRQNWRDTSGTGFAQQYLSEASRVDGLFSNPANSIATGMTDLFKQLQTTNNDPASAAARQLVIGSSQALLNKFTTLSSQVLDQNTYINQQLSIHVSAANTQIGVIADLNREIVSYGNSPGKPPPLDLLDKRDEAIRKLSELMELQVLDAENGEKQVFLSNGQSLVLENGKFNVLNLAGDPDPQYQKLELRADGRSSVVVSVSEDQLGGKIGGLLKFRSEVLEPTKNKLGQLAIGFADAFNSQNKLGMDSDGQIGGNIFNLPGYAGLAYKDNVGTGTVTGTFVPGLGKEVPANEFRIVFSNATNFTVEALDSSGNVVTTRPEAPATSYTLAGPGPYTFTSSDTEDLFGLEFTITNGGAAFANGDMITMKPLSDAAHSLTLATTRPEALAMASPIRGQKANTNLGNAEVDAVKVSSIGEPGNRLVPPSTLTDGPFSITYLGNNEFRIEDSGAPAIVETVTFAGTQYENLLASSVNFANAGFDFSIKGSPSVGDTFSIEYNVGGFKDNRNGLLLSELQNADTIRINAAVFPNADKYQSYNQAYGSMIGFVGERTSQARVASNSATSLLEQSAAWKESLSGVSMDEEAANLIRFQQAYSAAAKILSTSQTIFDTLLQAAR